MLVFRFRMKRLLEMFPKYASCVCLFLLVAHMIGPVPAVEYVSLGHYRQNICMETNASLAWRLPSNHSEFVFANLKDKHGLYIMSLGAGENWKKSDLLIRYHGRVYNTSAYSSFRLEYGTRRDIGTFQLLVTTIDTVYNGTMELMVYGADNYWPRAVDNSGQITVNNTSDMKPISKDEDDTSFRYTWMRPESSPAVGVQMYATVEDEQSETKECSFDHSSMCDIIFKPEDFGDFHGLLNLEIKPMFPPTAPHCGESIKPFYNLVTFIPARKGMSTRVVPFGIGAGGLIIVILGCVCVALITKSRNNQLKQITLPKGLDFIRCCTQCIQAFGSPYDLNRVYRENEPEQLTIKLIEVYNQSKNKSLALEEYKEKRVLLASAIKYFFKKEKSPWISISVQRNIIQGTNKYMGNSGFDVKMVKNDIMDTNSTSGRAKWEILAHIFTHFKWLMETRKTFPPNNNVVDINGLAKCVSPNLFKEALEESVDDDQANPAASLFAKIREIDRGVEFFEQMVNHAEQIFGTHTEPNVIADNANEIEPNMIDEATV